MTFRSSSSHTSSMGFKSADCTGQDISWRTCCSSFLLMYHGQSLLVCFRSLSGVRTYYDSATHGFNHYTMKTLPIDMIEYVPKNMNIYENVLIGILLRWGFLIWELIFIYCELFVLILVVSLCCFFFHYVSAKFHLWPSSGDLPRPRGPWRSG